MAPPLHSRGAAPAIPVHKDRRGRSRTPQQGGAAWVSRVTHVEVLTLVVLSRAPGPVGHPIQTLVWALVTRGVSL